MNKVKTAIWGRDFEIGIEYDCYTGETVLATQKEAIDKIVANKNAIDSALDRVKEYCLKNNKEEFAGVSKIENIFKYVIPKYLYVKRDDSKRIVAIMCNYKFDVENGIAVVFENEKFSDIGKQDIIL